MLFKILDYKFTGLICILAVVGYFSYEMFAGNKHDFLPGKMTSAHYQIELACDQCHTPFDGVKQQVCLDCHGDALNEASDSHAVKVFKYPRFYAMLELMDAKQCVTCHAEHLDNKHHGKVATVAKDFCYACHDDIEQERPSHKGFSIEGCSASGCHNYHDNTALYEDFLEKHLDEQDTFIPAVVPLRNIAIINSKKSALLAQGLSRQNQDASVAIENELIIDQWSESGHATSGVNCSHCHQPENKTNKMLSSDWTDKPSIAVCTECHKKESESFYKGKHGMRIAASLDPMKPRLARLPMKQTAHKKELTCNSCHSAHDYNTKKAAVDVCLNCHDDTHSKTYKESSHYQLWLKELSGESPVGSGVSCATCHLPRITVREEGANRILVNHNQNAHLRPNSAMIRSVCMHCHGLEFSLQSMADINLILNNYSTSTLKKHKTMDMIRKRVKK